MLGIGSDSGIVEVVVMATGVIMSMYGRYMLCFF